jgi:hypothetical protein
MWARRWCFRCVDYSRTRSADEYVFAPRSQIATFAQDWLAANVTPSTDAIGSLAMQMTRRAQDEERVRDSLPS